MFKKILVLFFTCILCNLPELSATDRLSETEQFIYDQPENLYQITLDNIQKNITLSDQQINELKKDCIECSMIIAQLKVQFTYLKHANDILRSALSEYPELIALHSQQALDQHAKRYQVFLDQTTRLTDQVDNNPWVQLKWSRDEKSRDSLINVINFLSNQYNLEYIDFLTNLGKRKECADLDIFASENDCIKCLALIFSQVKKESVN